MLLAIILCCGVSGLHAQGYFTLTNGHYYWFGGRESDPDDAKYLTGFDQANGWAKIYTRGTHSTESTTEIVAQGDTYLALDTTTNPARIQMLSTAGGFNPLCVWFRTGNTGNYYQEWNGYRYYLIASHSEGLSIYKVEANAPLQKQTTWYNWDHGCAITEQVAVSGGTKENYFWLIYDTLNDADGSRAALAEWRMSTVSSYQRPEEMIYRNYRADGTGGNTWDNANNPDHGITYYDNVRVGGTLNYPAGNAATFMEVKKTDHDRVITGIATGYGLLSVESPAPSISYGASLQLTANIATTPGNTVDANIIDAYTEYNEEIYRRGINLDYANRTSDDFGSAGVPTYNNWYYYNGNRYTVAPAEHPESLTIDSVRFLIDNRAQRYLSVSNGVNGDITTGSTTYTHHWHANLTCYDIPINPTTATLTATVYYSNGTTQQVSTTIIVTPADLSTEINSTKAPVIKGYVVGGGKMANVTGNTNIMVHNADSIYAIYGGNDIAGWVQGDEGATIQIGSRYTNANHPIHIDYIYGGGCGYYRYGGAYDALTNTWADNNTKTTNVGYGQYAFRGGVYDWNDPTKEIVPAGTFDYNPYVGADFATVEDGNRFVGTKLGGTVPYVKTSHINFGVPEVSGHTDAMGHNAHEHNDYIFVDSLFGGAENAFIGITSTTSDYASAVTVDINGGTILAAFGGNNYGGSIAQTALTFFNVNCTKMVDDRALTANTYFNGYGRTFGIRHLFGGGNKVGSSHAQLQLRGGMIDTAFVGGNNASVDNPVGILDCQRDGIAYNADGTTAGGSGFLNGHFIYTNNSIANASDTANNGLTWQNYDADNGLWNVHYFYGGNNIAPMNNVSFISLRSGGAGSIYGGGNQGDMTNDKTLAQAAAEHMTYFDIRPLLDTMSDILSYSTLVTVPNKIGSVIYAFSDSKVMIDYVYGGCRNANIKNSCGAYLAGGCYGDVVAGNDVSGDVGSEHDGATYLVVTKKTVVQGNIYGGCDGYYHCDDGTGHYSDQQIPNPFSSTASNDPYNDFAGLLLPTQQHANVFVNGGLIKGNVVGGGLLADIGFRNSALHPGRIQSYGEAERDIAAGTNKGTVRLEIGGTAEIRGNVFGGGANASIWGLSQVYVKETPTILGSLFAGNDCVGSVQSFLPYQGVVDYTGCANAHDSLMAESLNQASQLSSNGDSLNYYTTTVDGIKQYNPRYSTYVRLEDSPIINSVYGSGNGAWDYDGTHPEFPWTYVCPGMSGSRPDQASTFIDIHTSGGFIDTVFGGGAGCSVSDKVAVLLNNTGTTNTNYPASLPSGFAGGKTENYVGTIFGGNNFSDMNTVPSIMLVQGNVKNVYGGGNRGDMTKKETLYDICGNEVPGVSTYVLSESQNVTVTDTVFGGCRMSNTEGMSYVDVRKTSAEGIKYLYGGNDISGNIEGNTRIDVAGGTIDRIWGGSNGRYDYVPVGHQLYNVYNYGTYDSAHPEDGLIATAAKPDVDSTHINLWGGHIGASVFAGGSMADCRTTCIEVDDQIGCTANGISTGDVTINGAIYGGGEGRWGDLNARDFDGNRWGNVTGSTYVHLYHAKDVASARAYGGGAGGDVMNTYIKTYPSWNKPFLAIYGGCWGSEVKGTAYLEFNGDTLVNNLYGGNDFTGNVYRTEMVVNNGNFYNVYGGGNGDYPDSYYHTQNARALEPEFAYLNATANAYADGDSIERPNTEYIHITFNDGEVDSCLYGGGKLGTVFPLQKNSSGEYLYDQTRLTNDGVYRFIPDTSRTKATTVSDPEDFAYVVLNVHDGRFHRNVFGGGRGDKKNKKPVVYGLKVVNMDGGEIYESLYGGSEFVNDGYIAECKAATGANPTRADRLAVTTMRPSSIVNITGGIVGSNLYGTGYQGIVHGSSYVNIGQNAIDSSTVWRNSYGNDTEDSTYIKFKPGYTGGHSDALATKTLTLMNSIYSGANWGNASGQVTFNNPGFLGGESRIYIDGKDYNTNNDYVTSNPEMIIMRSIYGSGTSVLGGDVHSHIEVRNFGGMEACHPTKTLETIQRTDSLWLHNTAIVFTGTTDASQQYMSNRYSFKNVKQMNYRGYNVTEMQAAADNVENLGFYEQGTSSSLHSGEVFDTVEVAVNELNTQINGSACGDSVDICNKEYMVSPSVAEKRHTLIILDNGVNLSIGNSESSSTTYGAVTGFGYVTTPGGYQSSITARPKMELTGNFNKDDGGFVTTCDTVNKTRTVATRYTDINTDWAADGNDELPYTNHASTDASGFTGTTLYREWKVGDKMGLREVEATLLAHSNPLHMDQNWSMEITCGATPNTAAHTMGVAEAVFEMPATSAGHYYQLMGEGFVMTGSNGEIDLVDSAWHPTLNASLASGGNLNMNTALSSIGNWYDVSHQNPDANGVWINIPNGNANEMEGTKQIIQSPSYTFGLVMMPNGNFATSSSTTFDMPSIDHDNDPVTPDQVVGQDWPYFVINGNARVNSVSHYCSPKVYNDPYNPELKPSMRLYLTYDTSFTNTFNGNVVFKMMEYDENGRQVAPIQVKVNIQTIIDDIKDMEQDVLAMYNGGRTNTFSRKVEIVPCGEERNLYITGIRWMPTKNNGETTAAACSTAFSDSARFSLLPDTTDVLATIAGIYPHEASVGHPGDNNHNSHNRFAMAIIPTNNVSEDAGMANGWIRGTGARTNLYKLAYPTGTNAVKTCTWDAVGDSVKVISLKNVNGNDRHGYFLGTLDGRGSAMIDVNLGFDGSRVYDAMDGKGYVGKVELTLESFTEEDDISRGTFTITLYVKTRAHGDTIYMASANSVTRQIAPNKSVTVYPYSDAVHNGTSFQKNEIGKTPGLYVQTFRKALEDGIYQEGDVLCIIDTLKIDNTVVHITGPNGPAIEVIRYDGHHNQLPDEQSVYRGPMIVVSNGSTFTAENINFHGGGGAHIKHVKRSGGADDYDGSHNATLDGSGNLQFWSYTYGLKTTDKQPDTNRAYAPIIQAMGDGTTVNLSGGTIVQHNWNEYGSVSGQTDGNGMPASSALMGAISVTDGAILSLSGDVTVENNYGHTFDSYDMVLSGDTVSVEKAPGNGAIYVDGGTLELPESNRNTAVIITENHLMNPLIHTDPGAVTWWDVVEIDGVPERYTIDTAVLHTWQSANVLLTRKAPATGTDYEKIVNDAQSDLIVVKGMLGDKTKIGVRKWFPGTHERDTIRFATVVGGNNTVLANAVNSYENFLSDDGFNTFYNPAVSLTNAYFFRCATFRHQLASDTYVGPVHDRYPTLTLASNDVLYYGIKHNVCPTGGDSLIYSVQGGMMPYTYTWSDESKSVTFRTKTSPYSDAQVQYDLAGGENGTSLSGADRYAKYAASMSDTLLLPAENISTGTSSIWNHVTVTATDATGECQLYKNIDLRILMDHEAANAVTYWPKATAAADTASHRDNNSPWMADTIGSGWADTARSVIAIASRNFKGVQITPRVWVDRSSGTISATVLGDNNDFVYQWTADAGGDTIHELTSVNFCPGDTIFLYTEPRTSSNKFIMWDFDPYYRPMARYIVPAHDDVVTAYYGPNEYWHQHVNSIATADAVYDNNYYYAGNNGHGYVTTHHGDVHIYNENGLAWFISVVNGLNDAQARQFYFNKVYLHQKDGGYDMKNYLWTPVGTNHQPFRGWFLGVGSGATDTALLATGSQVVIKNIIVNEPQMNYAGFFGNIDTARISGIKLEAALIRGAQYVGTLAANSVDARINNVVVSDSVEMSPATTILATNYTSGGIIGNSERDTLTNTSVKAKFIGDAVYSGGMVGYGMSTTVTNSYGYNDSRMNGLYIGGVAGYLEGTVASKGGLFKRKSAAYPSTVANNYVRLESSDGTRVGGIAGYAKNSVIVNNYFYGDINNANGSGVAYTLKNSGADGNFYQKDAAKRDVGSSSGSTVTNTSTFEGAGNRVILEQHVHGRNNLTRVLNTWVREQNANGGDFLTWRSDLDDVNSGYPIFGQPDMIPVVDSMIVYGCDSVEWEGSYYADGDSRSFRVVDTVEMVDSTMTIRFAAHFSTHEQYADSALVGEDYNGYGFSLTAAETALLQATVDSFGTATLVLSDTLATEYGCDSVITLTLTFYANVSLPQVTKSHVLVYPNPTTARVTIEATGMKHVELYDNDGRRLADYDAYGNENITIDIKNYSTGVYYLRVHAADGVTIQKLIKK